MRPFFFLVLAGATGCTATAPARPVEDLYVWQRSWTPAVSEAVSHANARALRVLVAELPGAPSIALDRAALAHRAVVAVVRVEGSSGIDPERVAALLVEQVAALRANHVNVIGAEIDHDCAAARLTDYAVALAALRNRLGNVPLSITALPSWTDERALDDVLLAVDSVVLQLHSVDALAAGSGGRTLFVASTARQRAARFAARSDKPIWLALPNYGHVRGSRATALWVDPREVAAFVRDLDDAPIDGVVGRVWFRMPISDDRGTFGAETFAALRRGEYDGRVLMELVGNDVVLRGVGLHDALAPRRIDLPHGIVPADGAAGYRRRAGALVADGDTRLRPGEVRTIGFVIRGASEGASHVD